MAESPITQRRQDLGMKMRPTIFVIAGGLLAALPGAAQYGGRPGDTVMYVFTAKGTGTIQTLPLATVNTASGLQLIDPSTVVPQPFPTDFDQESRVVLHKEDGDVFEFILENPDILDPNQELLYPAKVLIAQGLLRISPPGEGDIDAPATFYTDFPLYSNVAPHYALNAPYSLVFWTPSLVFPVAIVVPETFVSPSTPKGESGADYIISLGVFPALIPWKGLDRTIPNAGWQQGTDSKTIERDDQLNTTARLIRLRPGRQTPPFSFDGDTHVLVVQGNVQIGPAGGTAQTLPSWQYAFVPSGYAITLSNEAVYAGPE
jgi:hypothetical protein